jgi:ankyrin repeat protein
MFGLTSSNQDLSLIAAIQQRQGLPSIQVIVMFHPPLLQVRGDKGLLPVHYAICLSPPEVVGFLTEQWPQCLAAKDDNGWLALHFAAEVSPIEVVQYLTEKWEPALQVKNNAGALPLHVAALNASIGVVQYLVGKYDAALDVTTNDGHLPLHFAVNKAPAEVVQYLVERRPQSLLVEDGGGDLPLHCAAEAAAQLAVVRCLVDRGKRALREKNAKGQLPLHIAAEHSPLEVVKFLVEQDRNALQAKDYGGLLPMHVAAQHASYPIVKFLAGEHLGALTTKSRTGQLPLDVARQRDDKAAANWLEGATRQQQQQGATRQQQQTDASSRSRRAAVQEGNLRVQAGNAVVRDDGIRVRGGEARVSGGGSNDRVPGRVVKEEEEEIDLRDWGTGSGPYVPNQESAVPASTDPHQQDRDRVRKVIELASLEPVAVSGAYVQSILTDKFLGDGFFGTVFKGKDPILGREFAIKSINTEILRGGSKQDLEDAMKTFKTEQEVRTNPQVPESSCLYLRGNLTLAICRLCLASDTRTLPHCSRTPTPRREGPPAATISCTSWPKRGLWKPFSRTTWVGAASGRSTGACKWRSTS